MAATQHSGDTRTGSNGFLYFAVGALIVAVGVLGYLAFSDQPSSKSPSPRSADQISKTARDIGDAAKNAARKLPTPLPQPVQPTAPTTLPPG